MKLEQSEFTRTLKGKIMEAERKFEKLCSAFTLKNKIAAAEKNLDFNVAMIRNGHDSFVPYYCSEIALGISKKDEFLGVHRIVIWECQREFLGLPLKWSIPGSKVVGEFIDKSYDHVAQELEEHLHNYLENAAS